MNQDKRIVIIGAGPCGMGAAWRLHELGHEHWTLLEARGDTGGLSRSIVDDEGFTWDLGGHVLFSHYEYFDKLCDSLLGDKWVHHVREAWVWMRDRFIPYPFQNNIRLLPPEDLLPCLDGLLEANKNRGAYPKPTNFREWIAQTFGNGIGDVFLYPYNKKVWAFDPSRLNVEWMGDRVPTIDLDRIRKNIIMQEDDVGWGPNATFRFPLHGGTGAIWKALHDRLPEARIQLGKKVLGVNAADKTVRLEGAEPVPYDYLITTMPQDIMLRGIDLPDLAKRADEFVYSTSTILGVGVDGPVPDRLKTKCWMYFPENNCPFYRVTVFSNYSPHNVPRPGEQWSLMAEVSESEDKPINKETVILDTLEGLRATKLLPEDAKIVSQWNIRLDHGYPTPFIGRDALLNEIDPVLRENGIWSRGRFGGWKYEVANQDHSLMQGVEAVDHILFDAEETTYRFPSVVNARKGAGRKPMA